MLGGWILALARKNHLVGFGSPNLTFSESNWESQSEESEVLQSNERPTQLWLQAATPCLLITYSKGCRGHFL
jgi:hypothetical protein